MDEVVKLRNRILKHAGVDIFSVVEGIIAERWVEEADAQLKAGNI
jgi:hypothetical protein